MTRHLLLILFLIPSFVACSTTPPQQSADILVYGGTPGGITAAIAASRGGASVILVESTQHLGGMSTSGLNRDEAEHMARDETFGGLAVLFFDTAAKRSGANLKRKARVWHSGIAEQVFLEMLNEAGVEIVYGQAVLSVEKDQARIVSIKTTSASFSARVFIDASYEGDLLARAGVSYMTGRESKDEFNESLAGVVYPDEPIGVSPYDANGNLLPGVMAGSPPKPGSASRHPTPYNIRLNLTTGKENRVEIGEPTNYDPTKYELLARCIQAGLFTTAGKIIGRYGMPGGKVEFNNRQVSVVSMSIPGEQTPWAEASYEQREKIHQVYRDYTHGLLWFLKTDTRVPQAMREDMARYALCKDEWVDNDHWPWQLYVREARRMRGAYLLTQADITTEREKEDAIHLGSHFMDSHQATRHATKEGGFINEGRLWQKGQIYQVPYRAITPKRAECDNLLVPVCVSSTHVAFCSIRVEASWMMLGEVAGIAATMATNGNLPIQSISVPLLQQKLLSSEIPIKLPNADSMDNEKRRENNE